MHVRATYKHRSHFAIATAVTQRNPQSHAASNLAPVTLSSPVLGQGPGAPGGAAAAAAAAVSASHSTRLSSLPSPTSSLIDQSFLLRLPTGQAASAAREPAAPALCPSEPGRAAVAAAGRPAAARAGAVREGRDGGAGPGIRRGSAGCGVGSGRRAAGPTGGYASWPCASVYQGCLFIHRFSGLPA